MKVSRLAKRRSEAHEALEHGRIAKDGRPLKPGYQVKPGDILEIHYATKFVTVRVREVPLRVTPAVKPADLYEILEYAKGRGRVAVISADTKDALARETPAASHCREALLAGLALYGSTRGAFVTHRNAVARLFWSLLDDRKAHPIESRAPTRLHRLPTFAIALPARLMDTPRKPVQKCDRLIEIRAAFLACGSLAAGAHGYHLEFVVRDDGAAARLQWMLRSAGVPVQASATKVALRSLLQGFRRDRRGAHARRCVRARYCSSKTCERCARRKIASIVWSTPRRRISNAARRLPQHSGRSSNTSQMRMG